MEDFYPGGDALVYAIRLRNEGIRAASIENVSLVDARGAHLEEAALMPRGRGQILDSYPPRYFSPAEWSTRAPLGGAPAVLPAGETKQLFIAIGLDGTGAGTVDDVSVSYIYNGHPFVFSTTGFQIKIVRSGVCSSD